MNEKLQYLKKLEAQIQEAQAVLIELKADRTKVKQELQHEEIDRLEEHLANAQIQMKDLTEVTEEAWYDLKDLVEELLSNLSNSVKKLVKK
ncbi:MAG: hypothetical protein ACFCU5_14405 [Pleurocapsa sp.]